MKFIKNLKLFSNLQFQNGFIIIKDKLSDSIVYPKEENTVVKNLVVYEDNLFYEPKQKRYYSLKTYPYSESLIKLEYIDVTDILTKYMEALKLIEELQIDFTTKLPNKRKLLNDMIGYINNTNDEYGLIICDIDHFKRVNDTYGHDFGDTVLYEVAETLKKCLRHDNKRPLDIIGRFGGEEFVILLKKVNSNELSTFAERVRYSIETMNGSIPITISLGTVHSSDYGKSINYIETYHELIKMADTALYYSKDNGRNTVTAYRNIKGTKKVK